MISLRPGPAFLRKHPVLLKERINYERIIL